MDIYIAPDDNTVFVMQQHNNDKFLTLTNNDDNNVFIQPNRSRRNTNSLNPLGGTYGTDLDLQMGTNNTSGPGPYSLTQDCQTVGGCTVSVTQN